jgi:hypothetical protein
MADGRGSGGGETVKEAPKSILILTLWETELQTLVWRNEVEEQN